MGNGDFSTVVGNVAYLQTIFDGHYDTIYYIKQINPLLAQRMRNQSKWKQFPSIDGSSIVFMPKLTNFFGAERLFNCDDC